MIFLSIVVPCFENKDILKFGLPSIERQSIKDFEVILIDDQSSNDLYQEITDYVNSDTCPIRNQVRIYRNDVNLGPGATRNRGIDLAKGKYILFLDADDYLKDNAIEILKDNNDNKDMVFYDFERIVGQKTIKYKGISDKRAETSARDVLGTENFSTWCKIYKRDFLLRNQLRMPDLLLGEDYVFTKLAMMNCTEISYVHEIIYVARDTTGSLTKKNPLGEFADEQYSYIERNWPLNQEKDALEGIFIYLKCFAKIWNLIEHKKNNEIICNYIKSLNRYGIDWNKSDYKKKLPRYQRVFLYAVERENVIMLRAIVWARKIVKRVYR